MPTLEFNEPTLNGKASICKYKGRRYFNLRVKRDGHRYTHISLNTEKLDQAHKNALDAYVRVMSKPPKSNKEKTSIKKFELLHSKCIDNFWHLVGHKVDIPKKNSYKCLNIGKYELFLYNLKNEVKVFLNKCPHRGSKIFNQNFGNSPLKCPYHGWVFTPSKTFVPRIDTFKTNPNPEDSRLESWKVKLVGGFIFIAKNPFFSLSKQLGKEVTSFLELIGYSLNKCESVRQITYDSNWLIAVENALEPYHLISIHPETLNELKLDDGINKIWDWASLWNAPSNNQRLHNSTKRLKNGIKTKFNIEGYWTLFLYPFAQISSTEGISYAIQFFDPCEKSFIDKTIMNTSLYSPHLNNNAIGKSLSSFYDSVSELNYKVFKEDADICAQVPLNSWTFSPLKYASSLEIKVDQFKKCCTKVINL